MKQEKLRGRGGGGGGGGGGDHVISIFISWTCPVDQNETRETVGTM